VHIVALHVHGATDLERWDRATSSEAKVARATERRIVLGVVTVLRSPLHIGGLHEIKDASDDLFARDSLRVHLFPPNFSDALTSVSSTHSGSETTVSSSPGSVGRPSSRSRSPSTRGASSDHSRLFSAR